MDKTILESKTKKELLEIAGSLKLSKIDALKKAELISLIQINAPAQTADEAASVKIIDDNGLNWMANHTSEQETISDSKYYEGFVQQSFPPQRWELPARYGDTGISLLIRDPFWIHSFWEVSDATFNSIRESAGKSVFIDGAMILRVYDVSDIDFNGNNAHSYFDINVGYEASSWYIHLPSSNRAYCADLGVMTPDGRFILIARSNIVSVPRHTVSEVLDEQWMAVEGRTYFDKMYALSGGFSIGASSGELPSERKELLAQRLEGVLNLSSGGLSLSSPMGINEEKQKKFWLVADTELIVYGATEPDAKLTVCGQPVKLNPDGSFRMRFALPDGVQLIPVEAVDKDGDQQRKIDFKVTRKKS
ncbi:MAG: DUF4912 domain-containing protein [Candidatus Margulisiibacteriota bacterium]|jgi:hypothetical protein